MGPDSGEFCRAGQLQSDTTRAGCRYRSHRRKRCRETVAVLVVESDRRAENPVRRRCAVFAYVHTCRTAGQQHAGGIRANAHQIRGGERRLRSVRPEHRQRPDFGFVPAAAATGRYPPGLGKCHEPERRTGVCARLCVRFYGCGKCAVHAGLGPGGVRLPAGAKLPPGAWAEQQQFQRGSKFKRAADVFVGRSERHRRDASERHRVVRGLFRAPGAKRLVHAVGVSERPRSTGILLRKRQHRPRANDERYAEHRVVRSKSDHGFGFPECANRADRNPGVGGHCGFQFYGHCRLPVFHGLGPGGVAVPVGCARTGRQFQHRKQRERGAHALVLCPGP